jgi:hypothetical protein
MLLLKFGSFIFVHIDSLQRKLAHPTSKHVAWIYCQQHSLFDLEMYIFDCERWQKLFMRVEYCKMQCIGDLLDVAKEWSTRLYSGAVDWVHIQTY